MKSSYADAPAYLTKDGSEIRELMHPTRHGSRRQSLAEATIAPGAGTHLHRHALSEELYHVSAGSGTMTLGDACFRVGVGDTVLIPAGTPHRIETTGGESLRILCCCCPPYSHEDTELLQSAA